MWDRILSWFGDIKERRALLNSFNYSARHAYTSGQVPILLQACITLGNSQFKTNYSWFRSGFRIKSLSSGYYMQRVEATIIAMIILTDTSLVRHLLALGFDTLEVGTEAKTYIYSWPLIQFSLPPKS